MIIAALFFALMLGMYIGFQVGSARPDEDQE